MTATGKVKRVRPAIPHTVRCRVALRDLGEFFIEERMEASPNKKVLLGALLAQLAELKGTTPDDLHCDHNPALRRRPYNHRIKNVAARYSPNANDVNFLFYLTTAEHNIATHVRRENGRRSDTSERVHENRLATNREKRAAKTLGPSRFKHGAHFAPKTKVLPKRPWPSRAFPKGRKVGR